MLRFEQKLWNQQINHIVGVDEAGRGPLAGPIVIAAVIFDKNHLQKIDDLQTFKLTKSDVISEIVSQETLEKYALINDSKKLSEKKRNILYEFIIKNAVDYSIVEISHTQIDEWGVGKANKVGFKESLRKLNKSIGHILTDHFKIEGIPVDRQTNITKGDTKSITIAAASILAKVHRDRIMVKAHEKFPEYNFAQHKGYGTKFHREKILEIGPCEIHRKSFDPVKRFYI